MALQFVILHQRVLSPSCHTCAILIKVNDFIGVKNVPTGSENVT